MGDLCTASLSLDLLQKFFDSTADGFSWFRALDHLHRSNGRGHGWRMWKWAIGLACDLGAKKLRITTDLKNAIILGMAAKLGFKQTRELPDERVEMIADL